jgi:hypothetical protein
MLSLLHLQALRVHAQSALDGPGGSGPRLCVIQAVQLIELLDRLVTAEADLLPWEETAPGTPSSKGGQP